MFCLDAYDPALSDRLIAEGKLPAMERLRAESARFALEHGPGGKARYTGLTWEHFSSGRTPEASGKWSVISFDPNTYRTWQTHATERPFLADLAARCVIYDVPYFDLRSLDQGVGLVGWGGHDTGVPMYSLPAGLMAEITHLFGAPPDSAARNATVYPSVRKTTETAEMLRASVRRRADIAEWLLADRFPSWDIGMIGMGESHDVIELLYHGVDSNHPLAQAGIPSLEAARRGVTAVYQEISVAIERLMDRFPDATFAAFTMHGMGANDTDVPTMLLLPELMYRMSFDRPLFRSRDDWRKAVCPVLRTGEEWNAAVIAEMHHRKAQPLKALGRRASDTVRRAAGALAGRILGARADRGALTARFVGGKARPVDLLSVDWMPAIQYARYWREMKAFALPAYFDGRVRINLQGRERSGMVPFRNYIDVLDRIEEALRRCVDIQTGEPVVQEITRPGVADPFALPATQADLRIFWSGCPVGFRHADYGDIGPGPWRRLGGHSGGDGMLYVRGNRIAPGDRGRRSSFDVAPTIVDLMGKTRPERMDGQSVFQGTSCR